jgi:hypothetical protein
LYQLSHKSDPSNPTVPHIIIHQSYLSPSLFQAAYYSCQCHRLGAIHAVHVQVRPCAPPSPILQWYWVLLEHISQLRASKVKIWLLVTLWPNWNSSVLMSLMYMNQEKNEWMHDRKKKEKFINLHKVVLLWLKNL